MDKTVAMIGLGIMGGAISRNLVARGWKVIGYDIDTAKRAELAQAGVTVAADIAQLVRDAPNDPKAALDFMARRVLCRPLRAAESPILEASYTALLAHYTQAPADATALLTFGESKADPALPPPPLAAWTMVASQLMNLDETLNK